MATFITSKAVGQSIGIHIATTTGYWSYTANERFGNTPSGMPRMNIPVPSNKTFEIVGCTPDFLKEHEHLLSITTNANSDKMYL